MAKDSDTMEAVRLLQSRPLQVETAPATSNPGKIGDENVEGLGRERTLRICRRRRHRRRYRCHPGSRSSAPPRSSAATVGMYGLGLTLTLQMVCMG